MSETQCYRLALFDNQVSTIWRTGGGATQPRREAPFATSDNAKAIDRDFDGIRAYAIKVSRWMRRLELIDSG